MSRFYIWSLSMAFLYKYEQSSLDLCNSVIFLAHLAYHCKNWQRRCEKSCHWTAWAYCLPQSAGPELWHWQGLGVNPSVYGTDRREFKFPTTCVSSHLARIISEAMTKERPHLHVQHVWVCELHKEIFVLEHSWIGAEVWGEMLLFAYLHDVMRWHNGIYSTWQVLPKAIGSDLSPGVATMIWSRDSLFVSIL